MADEKMKYEDLSCEFCNGKGEREVNIDGMDCPTICSFCDGTGIDHDQIRLLFKDRLLFRDKIQSLHKGESNDLMDKGWNEAIEHITKNIL